jgi:hypothetical protein
MVFVVPFHIKKTLQQGRRGRLELGTNKKIGHLSNPQEQALWD